MSSGRDGLPDFAQRFQTSTLKLNPSSSLVRMLLSSFIESPYAPGALSLIVHAQHLLILIHSLFLDKTLTSARRLALSVEYGDSRRYEDANSRLRW